MNFRVELGEPDRPVTTEWETPHGRRTPSHSRDRRRAPGGFAMYVEQDGVKRQDPVNTGTRQLEPLSMDQRGTRGLPVQDVFVSGAPGGPRNSHYQT